MLAWPEVVLCELMTGAAAYLTKVVTTDAQGYDRFLRSKLFTSGLVTDSQSRIVVSTVKTPVRCLCRESSSGKIVQTPPAGSDVRSWRGYVPSKRLRGGEPDRPRAPGSKSPAPVAVDGGTGDPPEPAPVDAITAVHGGRGITAHRPDLRGAKGQCVSKRPILAQAGR